MVLSTWLNLDHQWNKSLGTLGRDYLVCHSLRMSGRDYLSHFNDIRRSSLIVGRIVLRAVDPSVYRMEECSWALIHLCPAPLLPDSRYNMIHCFQLQLSRLLDMIDLSCDPDETLSPLSCFCPHVFVQQRRKLRWRGSGSTHPVQTENTTNQHIVPSFLSLDLRFILYLVRLVCTQQKLCFEVWIWFFPRVAVCAEIPRYHDAKH